PGVTGLATLGRALVRNPVGTLPAVVGGPLRLGRRQLVSREVPAATGREYARRWGRAAPLAQWQWVCRRARARRVGGSAVVVLGSAEDRVVQVWALRRAARIYGGAPLLFGGEGRALSLDARWREPLDAILDWLEKA